MRNEELLKAREEYAHVGERYVNVLREKGLIFQQADEGADERASLRAQLEARGAAMRNAGASISVGHLSPACVECTGSRGSETFSTTFKCHRDCYFCFNRNQPDYERFVREGCPWEEGLARCASENESLACIGLTGGEPLLNLDDSLAFLARAGELFPDAHKRMYTSGDLLTEEAAQKLAAAGLDEIRFSVKDDDSPAMRDRVLNAMRIAKRHIPSVMVEMPIIPGAEEAMKDLFLRFEEVGIDGINLLEFCFPFCNWEEFARRGFVLRNPPFEVMYDYGYSGGLAVAGSEEAILRLMLWALDQGLTFGMHYCSLENKHRSEMRQKNERAAGVHPCITFDENDFFLKTAKVFGPDIPLARTALEAAGCKDFIADEDEGSLAFPPEFARCLNTIRYDDGSELAPQTCYLVYESGPEGSYLIDVALKPFDEGKL